MTSRSEKINEIIACRKPIAEKTAKTVEHLKAVSASLEQFRDFLPKVGEKIDNAEQKNAIESLRPDFDRCLTLSSDCQTKLRQIELRFSRPTLNIGIVGNARQGKSKFLQALTGLTDDEIPSAPEDHCTGAPSMIVNRPDLSETSAYADLDFYTKSEFLRDVILPFYNTLGLSPQPVSFDNFANTAVPQPSRQLNATEKELYKKLSDRQARCNEYRELLDAPVKHNVPKNEILKYIAQQDKKKNKLAKWIAVKLATIYCPFKIPDAGTFSLCDTPGLGDFVCGAEANLVHNIADNIDSIMMFSKIPDGSIVEPNHTQLYDLIPQAIPEFSPKDWTHYVVNRWDKDSDSALASFVKKIEDSSIKVRRIITLNAVKQEDVLANFDTILKDIAGNQQNLDETLYKARFKEVEKLVGEIQTLVEKATNVLPKSVGNIGFGQLQPLFNDVWKKVTFGLSQIVKEYRKLAEEPDGRLAAAVDEIKKSQATYLEGRLDKVSEEDYAGGKLSVFTPELQHELRIELSKAFDKLDKLFQADFAAIRQKAVDVFIAADKGKLGGIIERQEPVQWLTDMAKRWQDIDSETSEIADTIKTFATSAFSFSAYLLPRVREKLNVLDSDSSDSLPFGYASGDDWDAVRDKIESAFEKALNEVSTALKKLSTDVSRARFAMIEQFADGIMRSGSHEVAKNRWYAFYEEYRAYVWTDIFAKLEENTALRNDWNRYVADIESKTNELK
ncbi:MAG: hypothetical protein LBU65_10385 [Planctomycetaceae bacterium]|jgi:hypothetical protein|nr:hypothetical protein [Planctomycetaceae bacterium]